MDLAKDDELGGVLYTGDMAIKDKESYYYITGRKKRFVKLFGNRVNLDEAELLVKNSVTECFLCDGKDDKLVIYITEKDKEKIIKEMMSSKTGIHQSAFFVSH